MKTYQVLDAFFNPIGTVEADDAQAALIAAKKRWKFIPALMVEEVHGRH